MAKKSKKKKARPKRSRKPVKRKYVHGVEEQRHTIPLILALANKILETIGFVDFINESVEWDDEQCKVTPGHLAKAVILATFFDIRAPLSLIKDRYRGIDTEFFFGEGISNADLNDYAIGRTLDKIAEANPDRLFSTIGLSTYAIYNIAFKRLHSDTTTLSFYGEYDLDPEISEEEAYADGEGWVELGTFGSGKKACSYKGKAYTKAVDNRDVQLLVFCSSAGEARFQSKKEKVRQALVQDITDTNKKVFVCEADAQEEWKRFCKSHKKSLYLDDVLFVETTQEKRPRGNPTSTSRFH